MRKAWGLVMILAACGSPAYVQRRISVPTEEASSPPSQLWQEYQSIRASLDIPSLLHWDMKVVAPSVRDATPSLERLIQIMGELEDEGRVQEIAEYVTVSGRQLLWLNDQHPTADQPGYLTLRLAVVVGRAAAFNEEIPDTGIDRTRREAHDHFTDQQLWSQY